MLRRYFIFGMALITAVVLGTATFASAMPPVSKSTQAPAGAQATHTKTSPKKKKNGVERAASDAGRSTKKTSKAVAKSGSKTGTAVAKSSKSIAKDSGEVVGAGAKAVTKGANETVKAPAKLVRKIGHPSKRRSNSKAQ